MKIIVTGGAGFIGSHVVDQLTNVGHEITVIDVLKPHRDDVNYLKGDILDLTFLMNALRGMDYVYHLAAVSNVNVAYENPIHTVQLNTVGTANILEAARVNGLKRVFLASTVWVYTGTTGENLTEDTPFYLPEAGHIYSSTKIAAELYCHNYNKLYNQPFTILRYGIPYGPRMREELVIPTFLRKAMSGEPITIMGDGSQYRNFVYVEDLAKAHVLALDPIAINQTYNLEGLEKVSVKQVAETINKLLGGVEISYIKSRPGDFKGKIVSAKKAKEELGWQAITSFEEGMAKTVEWYCSKTGWIANGKVQNQSDLGIKSVNPS